jgi:hypothetical protein
MEEVKTTRSSLLGLRNKAEWQKALLGIGYHFEVISISKMPPQRQSVRLPGLINDEGAAHDPSRAHAQGAPEIRGIDPGKSDNLGRYGSMARTAPVGGSEAGFQVVGRTFYPDCLDTADICLLTLVGQSKTCMQSVPGTPGGVDAVLGRYSAPAASRGGTDYQRRGKR